jgi:CheY-like chemotaxis protein
MMMSMPVVLVVSPDFAVHAAVIPALIAEACIVVSVRDGAMAIATLQSLPATAVIGDTDAPELGPLRDYLRQIGLGDLQPLRL